MIPKLTHFTQGRFRMEKHGFLIISSCPWLLAPHAADLVAASVVVFGVVVVAVAAATAVVVLVVIACAS